MKKKIIGIFMMTLLISCLFIPIVNSKEKIHPIKSYDTNEKETQTANIFIKKYDPIERTCRNELIKQMSLEDALSIKRELIDSQHNIKSSKEVIRNQFNIMHKWDLLDPNIDFDDFENVLNSINRFKNINMPTISTDVTILGPSIISFLTIGGIIFPLHLILWDLLGPIWWNSTRIDLDIFGGTAIAAQLLISPAMALYCSAMTFINSIGVVIGPRFIISPFVSILVGVAGFSITANILTSGFEMNVFDWSVGLCLTGLVAFISQIQT